MRFCKTHFLFFRTNNRFTGCGEPERTRLWPLRFPCRARRVQKKRAATLLGSGPCIRKRKRWLEQLFNRSLNLVHIDRGLEASDQIAVPVNEELGEVPPDVGFVAVLFVVRIRELLQTLGFQPLTEPLKGLFGRELGEQRVGRVAVDVDLFELREFGAELQGAELVNLIVGFGRLAGELVAGEVENREALVLVGGVDALEVFVLRGEAAAGGGVDDEDDLALVVERFLVVPSRLVAVWS